MSRPARTLFLTIAAASVLGAACVGRQKADEAVQTAAAAEARCRADADCVSGFCDRGVCQTPAGTYGRPCTPAPRTAEGPREGMLNVCGAYLCVQGRCRSCQSDAECRAELGSPRCAKVEGEPGLRCGNPPP